MTPHAYIELAVALLCLAAGIVGWRRGDRYAGAGFLCIAVGFAALAVERLLPASRPWLGDIGCGVLLVACACFAARFWHMRQRLRSTNADRIDP
jgi:hypothetical protein